MNDAIPVATYVRHTVDRLTNETRKPDQDAVTWGYVHLLNIVVDIGYDHPELVRAAADKAARFYGLPPQSEVESRFYGLRPQSGVIS